jgi:hypothetical protein
MIIGMARGPIPDFPRDRPTVPEVAPLIGSYLDRHPIGGNLHIVLEDGNIEVSHVLWCMQNARERGDDDAIRIADLMSRMTSTQRRKLVCGGGR